MIAKRGILFSEVWDGSKTEQAPKYAGVREWHYVHTPIKKTNPRFSIVLSLRSPIIGSCRFQYEHTKVIHDHYKLWTPHRYIIKCLMASRSQASLAQWWCNWLLPLLLASVFSSWNLYPGWGTCNRTLLERDKSNLINAVFIDLGPLHHADGALNDTAGESRADIFPEVYNTFTEESNTS